MRKCDEMSNKTRLPLDYAHSARLQWTDDDDKLPRSYPYRKYMVCMVLNIIQCGEKWRCHHERQPENPPERI